MILRAGFQTFEFQQALELPKPLSFTSSEDALQWLNRLVFIDPDLLSRFREYVTRHSGDPDSFRLNDHEALERLAVLLHLRRIVVVSREQRTASGQPGAKTAPPAPAFPLSERPTRQSAASSPPPPVESSTFDPNIDPAAQASALVAAAADGKPFCPE